MSRRIFVCLFAAALVAVPLSGRAQPISGLYVSGSGGINATDDTAKAYTYHPGINISHGPYPVTINNGYAVSGAFGYGFGAGTLRGFRVEIEASYRSSPLHTLSTPNGLFTFAGNDQRSAAMLNIARDFDIGLPVYPYVGAGAGVALNAWSNLTTTNQHTTIGTTVTDLVAKETTSDSVATFAVQAIAGVAYPVAALPGLTLTLDYKFFSLPNQRNFNDKATLTCGGAVCLGFPNLVAPGYSRYNAENNHSIMFGVRYAFGG
jgi:hypothetical protein